jgi:hypothetical protein
LDTKDEQDNVIRWTCESAAPGALSRRGFKRGRPQARRHDLGRWEGDTLVIDSIGFKEKKVWIDENTNPHSDALHVVERWTRSDADHILVETLIEDPKFHARPITHSRTWCAWQTRRGNSGELVQREQRRCGASWLRARTDSSRWYSQLHRSCAAATAAPSYREMT